MKEVIVFTEMYTKRAQDFQSMSWSFYCDRDGLSVLFVFQIEEICCIVLQNSNINFKFQCSKLKYNAINLFIRKRNVYFCFRQNSNPLLFICQPIGKIIAFRGQ